MSESKSGHLVGYAPGVWDEFHVGHLDFLRRARELCDLLVVGVLTDELAQSTNGGAPRFSLVDRLEVMRAVRMVDEAVSQQPASWLEFWEQHRFDILFLNESLREDAATGQLEEDLQAVGARVLYLPHPEWNHALRAGESGAGESEAGDERPQENSVSTSPQFRVLLVCTANLCRSPMAQQLLARRVADAGLPWVIESAGTRAAHGQAMHPFALQALETLGLVGDPAFATKPVTADLVADQDLILTATYEQRAWVVSNFPKTAQRVYVLKQFAHLVSAVPEAPADAASAGRQLMERAITARSRVQPLRRDRDLADPINRPLTEFVARAHEIDRILARILPASSFTEGSGAPG